MDLGRGFELKEDKQGEGGRNRYHRRGCRCRPTTMVVIVSTTVVNSGSNDCSQEGVARGGGGKGECGLGIFLNLFLLL